MKTKLVVGALAMALLAAACGSSSQAVSDDSTTSDEEQALLDFAECMREQGVDIPDPTVDSEGNVQIQPPEGAGDGQVSQGQQEEFRDAFDACRDHLEGLSLGFSPEDQSEFQDQALEFAQCLRDHGFDVPDPDFSDAGPGNGGQGGGPFGDIDQDDPAFQEAAEECQTEVFGEDGPRFGPPGGGDGS